MKPFYLSSIILFTCILALAQESTDTEELPPFELGIGVGFDYGGVGAKFSIIPFSPRIQIFAGLGHNGAGPGFNTGVLVRYSPEDQFTPYFTLMYGYNGVLITESASGVRTEKTYYGPSFGGGIEFRMRSGGNFFNLGLLFPVHFNKPEDSPKLIKTLRRPTDIMLSVGYHFILSSK